MDEIVDKLLQNTKYKKEKIAVQFLQRRVGLDYKYTYKKVSRDALPIKKILEKRKQKRKHSRQARYDTD